MIRQSARTGRTFSTSSIQREVIQAQGHTGSNQNCTFSRTSGCAVTLAGNRRPHSPIPRTGGAGRRRCSPRETGRRRCSPRGTGDAGGAPTRDGPAVRPVPWLPRAARRCARLGSAGVAGLEGEQPGGAVVARGRGGRAAPLPQRLVQERDAVSLPVGGGELRGLPGLLRAVAQAARLQPEQGGGAVIAEGRAGLTPPLPQRLVQEDDGGPLPGKSPGPPEPPHLIPP